MCLRSPRAAAAGGDIVIQNWRTPPDYSPYPQRRVGCLSLAARWLLIAGVLWLGVLAVRMWRGW
jgi:hypothetical protein